MPTWVNSSQALTIERNNLATALRDLLTGISVHNDRLTPGKMAERIEGPVVDAAIRALQSGEHKVQS